MAKKLLKIVAILIAVAIIAIQFIRIDQTDPPSVESESLYAAIEVPTDVRNILERSCADCHSHNTRYPWYANVQPSAWFLKDHIDDARRKMNFSTYNTYPLKKKAHKLEEVCEQVESKEMPLPSYLWLHRDAVLSETDRTRLCEWAKGEKSKLDAQLPEEPKS